MKTKPASIALLPLSALMGTILLWGVSFVLTGHLLEYLEPIQIMFLRFALASLLLLPFQIGRPLPAFKDMLFLLGISLLQPGLYFFGETLGIQNLGPSLTSLIVGTIPLFVALLAWPLLKEKPGPRFWIAFIISLAGLLLLFLPGHLEPKALLPGLGGISLGLLAGALYIIFSRKISTRVPSIQLTFWQFAYATVFFAPLFFLQEKSLPAIWSLETLMMLFLVLGPTAGAFFFYNFALGKIPAGRASLGLNLIPLVTVLVSFFFLGETLVPIQMLGGALALAGLFVAQQNSKSSKIRTKVPPAR